MGCAPELPEQISSLEPGDGYTEDVRNLRGNWTLNGHVWSSCPSEWRRAIPIGDTEWTTRGDQLTVRVKNNPTNTTSFQVLDARTLEEQRTFDILGCTATESLTLVIDDLNTRWARGVYSLRLSHDGSQNCTTLAKENSLPENCETLFHWQARRGLAPR